MKKISNKFVKLPIYLIAFLGVGAVLLFILILLDMEKEYISLVIALYTSAFIFTGISRRTIKKLETELKEYKDKYILFENTAQDMICIIDANTLQYIYVTGATFEMLGYNNQELIGKNIEEFSTSKSFEFVKNILADDLKKYYAKEVDSINRIVETQQYHKNGSLVWIECAARMTFNENNQPDKIISVNRKIDDRKKLELELKDREAKYRLMASYTNDMFWTLDVNTLKFTYMAGAAFEISGYTAEEYLNMTIYDILPPSSLKIVNEIIKESVNEYVIEELEKRSEAGRIFEIQQYHKNGSLMWIEISAKLLPFQSNSLLEIVATSRLIDNRKKLELELKESENRYKFITEGTNDFIWAIDVISRKFTYASGACFHITGFSVEEILQMKLDDIMPSKSVEIVLHAIEAELDKYILDVVEGRGAVFEVQQYHKNGSLMWVEISSRVIYNEKTNSPEVISSARIIDDRKKLELQLRESENKNKLITDNMNDMVWIIDANGFRFTYMSGAALEISGYTSEEYLDLDFKDFLPNDSYVKVINFFQNMVDRYKKDPEGKENIVEVFEAQQYHKNGSLIWLEVSVRLVYMVSENYNYIALTGSTRLIDERKKLELQLKESEEKYRIITENSKDPIWTMDYRTFKYTFMSERCYELYGYTPEEYLSANLKETWPQSSFYVASQVIADAISKYMAGEIDIPSVTFEIQQYHKNRSLIWVEISIRILPNDKGELETIVATTRNIEERKRLETELKESELKYRLMAENMKDSLWILDVETFRYTFRSESSIRVSGHNPEELVDASLDYIFSQESINFIKKLIGKEFEKYYKKLEIYKESQYNEQLYGEKIMEPELPEAIFEIQQYHKNGNLIWVEISAKALPSTRPDGLLTNIVGTTRLINDRKAAEQKILEQQKVLEQNNATKNKFFSIIAHDLKNPFTALLNASTILKESFNQINNEQKEKYIDMMHKTSMQIYTLLENLLEWARSSMDHIKYEPMQMDICELINDALQHISGNANSKKITIEFETNAKINDVICDRYMIQTVIRNLLSNAIKFSRDGSNIFISVDDYYEADLNNDYLRVSIRDFGVGMSAEKLSKLFKIDEKSISTEGVNKEIGTGLGLILCKEFIDKHKCKIWVISKENEGTTFFFTLPKVNNNSIVKK